jgi:hypothetical protein
MIAQLGMENGALGIESAELKVETRLTLVCTGVKNYSPPAPLLPAPLPAPSSLHTKPYSKWLMPKLAVQWNAL